MSQAVANVKQFAKSIKTESLSDALGGRNMPSSFTDPKKADKHGNDAKNPYVSPTTLRAQKKAHKQKVKDAKSGKFDRVTGSSPDAEKGRYDSVTGYGQDPINVKSERIYPNDDIVDAEIVETKAIDAPRKAIEPGRQWSNG